MRKIIYLMIFLLVLSTVSAVEYHFEIYVTNNGTLTIDEVDVRPGEMEKEGTDLGDSRLEVIALDFERLYETNFKTSNYYIREGDLGRGFIESEIVYYNITELILYAPYYKNTKEIVIYDEFGMSTKMDVSDLKPPKKPINYTLIITIAAVLLVIIFLIVFLRRKTVD